ncbi:YafY family transcriptional regulator [bacterium]|nr:YafY family transcriptional regulator [bacterium]
MNRIDRLTAILIHLQSKKIVKAKEIANRFEISIRTVYRDIRALEDAGIPIGAQAGEGYSIVEGYYLPPVMFTRKEAGALLFGGKLIEKFSDKSIKESFESSLFKIRSVLGDDDKEYIETLNTNIEVLNATPRIKGKRSEDFLADLQLHVGQHKMVEIVYHSSYKNELTTRLIEPIGLCFWGANWHLIAYCSLRNDYRDFRVNRIREMTSTGMFFNPDQHDSLQNLVRDLNTQVDLSPVTVKFKEAMVAAIADQKYYQGLVEERHVTDGVEMDFMISSIPYFSKWILTFIDEVEIVSPNALKKLLKDYAAKLYKHYS